MHHLEIKRMNELTNDYMTNKSACDELATKIRQTQNLLERLTKEFVEATEKRTKAEQALEEQFNYLVGKANRKQFRKIVKDSNEYL